MNTVKFPYGVSNFEQLSTQNFTFVDKTKYIQDLEDEKYVSFLRPRRFGKSLWLSILEYYYDINQKNKFEQLFGKYYIGKYPTPLRNTYRILKFDFSGIDTSTKESAKQGFNLKIKTYITGFSDRYECLSKENIQSIYQTEDAEEILSIFCEKYDKKYPIYLLIDEYDHFTNEILYRSVDEFIDSVSKQGYVRKFFEVIKTATQQGIVDRVFITGVSPLTLDGITSGFNILTHLTHHLDFEAMMGFTQDEVESLLELVLQDSSRKDEVIQEMKEWYNGYKFSRHSTETLYNSDMVLYYLKYFARFQTRPEPMLDPNIAPDYGKLKQMFEVVNMYENKQVLQEVLANGTVQAPLITQFSFTRGFKKNELINFLAYLGNLTIESIDMTGRVKFKVPNKVIEELYWQYYADTINENSGIEIKSSNIDKAIENMAKYGEYERFFEMITKVLESLSNRDFIQFNEKQVKMVIIAYLMLAGIFDVISEREVQSGGYPDLMLFKRPSNPYEHHEFVIELKYLKKEQANEVEKTMQEAKEQVLYYYKQDKTLQNRPYLHLLTVVAVKDELHVEKAETI